MERSGDADGWRTLFLLGHTCRNLHQPLTLVYPDRQREMLRSMTGDVRGAVGFRKWELYGRETFTMEGDGDPGDRRQLDEGPSTSLRHEAMRRPRRPVRRTACGPTSTPISHPAVLRQRPCGEFARAGSTTWPTRPCRRPTRSGTTRVCSAPARYKRVSIF